MNANEWIAFVAVTLTLGTALITVAYQLGRLSERVDTHEDDTEKLIVRVDAIEAWRGENSGDMKVMRVLLENINAALNGRKSP